MIELTDRFEDALVFATQCHHGHMRKGTSVPYISHLLQVAGLVLEYGGDEDQAIAGLLHDVVEDGKATIGEVREKFGQGVAAIVEGCSDTMLKEGTKEPWLERKMAYVERLKTEPETIRLVSAADKLHNARAILSDYRKCGDEIFKLFRVEKALTLWYYHALIDVFRQTDTNPGLVGELQRTIAELGHLVYGE